ncbi:BTB-2 domain-containing protein [Aphelenchoides bicaudatus]|nr:BTB-2 domain-containing protein [Aphelenchoides bicaudatus]
MPAIKTFDDILNINVGGKKYTVRRSDLLADPRSKLADIFRPNSNKPLPTDKGGNIFLNRDPKCFRDILAYLRMKNERFSPSFALPCKPDDLAKLIAECEALNLVELKEYALELLQSYQRQDEQHYVNSFVKDVMKNFEAWQFDRDQGLKQQMRNNFSNNETATVYDDWENM